MPFVTLHPGFEAPATANDQAPRLASLAGSHIGLLDNNKKSVGTFLSLVADILVTRYGVAEVTRVRKPNASVPVPDELVEQLKTVDAVITGIGD